MQPTYNGTVFNLTCTIVLDPSVDTGVNVTERWSDSDSTLTTDRMRCISITGTVLVSTLTYQTVLTFDPLGNNSRDGDSYICEATVIPDTESNYILGTTGMGDYELSVTGWFAVSTSCNASNTAEILNVGLFCFSSSSPTRGDLYTPH